VLNLSSCITRESQEWLLACMYF